MKTFPVATAACHVSLICSLFAWLLLAVPVSPLDIQQVPVSPAPSASSPTSGGQSGKLQPQLEPIPHQASDKAKQQIDRPQVKPRQADHEQQKLKSPPDKPLDDDNSNLRQQQHLNQSAIISRNKLSGHLRFEFQRYDGWYNNLANSDWGTPNSRLRRKVAPAYSDGVYQMNDDARPSARSLSQRMMRGEDGLASRRNMTTIFAFFGQVISSEILMASESGCPIEMHRIKVDKCDPMYDKECRGGKTMPFYRAAYDPRTGQSPNLPREQLNRVTSWIDGSFIYSTSETWLNTMRSFDGKGTLKMVASPQVSSPSGAPSSSSSSGSSHEQNGKWNLDTMLLGPSALAALANSLAGYDGKQSPMGKQERPPVEAMMSSLVTSGAPMSLFGYPARNKMRAPLINNLPAHHLKVKTAERMFLLGDARTNQNPMILAFGILFYRWHNVLAERIHAQHPDWSDEEIFQRARRLVIASLQNIFLYEYLPVLLDTPSPNSQEFRNIIGNKQHNRINVTNSDLNQQDVEQFVDTIPDYERSDLIRPYTGYKPDLHPGISHVFQSAAFRFGHTMIPPGLYLRDDKCNFLKTPTGYKGIRLCSTWWNAEEVVSKVGIEHLLMGAASQIAEREDYVLCNDVRDKLFGPLDFSRRDLAALNIMRGRDNGLADYNTVRQAFKLPKISQWRDINPALYAKQPDLFNELARLYDNQLDRVDLYVGGMLESDFERGRPGILFRRIIKEQFERLRDSDRFWFENVESGVFSEAEIEEIKRIKLYDILVNSTLIPDDAIQRNVFQFKGHSDPCPQPGQLSSSQLQPCYIMKGHSYFKGNETVYAVVCALLVVIPAVCWLVANYAMQCQDSKRRRIKTRQGVPKSDDESKGGGGGGGGDKVHAKEWLHSNLRRKIKIKFGSPPDQTIYILDRQGQVQRKLDLSQVGSIVVEVSSDLDYTIPLSHPLQSSRSIDTLNGSSSSASMKSGSIASLVSGASSDSGPNVDLDQPLSHKPMVLLRIARNYDLVLQFYDLQARHKFVTKLHNYLTSLDKSMSLFKVPRDVMLLNAETKERRQQRLEQFFREAYSLTFGLEGGGGGGGGAKGEPSKVSPDVSLVMKTSLSRQEFAEALGMRADSLFVKQMFNCIDKDSNGSISFQEFLDTVVLFSRGKPDDKLRIVFDMCDHGRKGVIEKAELVKILRSLVDIAKTKALTEDGVLQMINEMFKAVGLESKPLLTYEDFKLIIGNHNSQATFHEPFGDGSAPLDHEMKPDSRQILAIGLDMKGAKKNFFVDTSVTCASQLAIKSSSSSSSSSSPPDLSIDPRERKFPVVDTGFSKKAPHKSASTLPATLGDKWRALVTSLEEHRQDIVYLIMFYVIIFILFFERFIQYSFLSEHMDLRHVMGVGIAITRGSAASLSFCYAMLLLSMCRNIMTWIRTMGVREYIPLDSHVKFHKIVAITALVMTVLHTVGHCVNFFHVTQQPVEHLRCLTKEMQFSGESRPTFFYWIFQTVTGTTGLLLWTLCSIIYVFARRQVRERAYSVFWTTHKLYYLIYALTLLHGSSKLTGSPRFWIFFLIPAILFAIDKIMSLQTKILQLEIFETECLPSDVISVKFARPPNFKFLSGQWVRVACTAFRKDEFHAFTLTSAPQDDYLSIHVRAQGPWTWKLRSMFDPANLQYNRMMSSSLPPRIRVDGPFGGGNQDWYKYEVAIMIGGGIGVTPYASILNDLVFVTSSGRYSGVANKKVYFIWICPSHRNFEWFIDVLRDVESKDVKDVLEMHVFITQFFHKFDLRTTMLYICENHFQRVANKSLFTGLKAINHFGRPDIGAILSYVQNKHRQASKVGVFSCGPKAMTRSINEACEKVNKRRKLPYFSHQYENFS